MSAKKELPIALDNMTHEELCEMSFRLRAQSAEMIAKGKELMFQSKAVRFQAQFLIQKARGRMAYIKECASCGACFTPSEWSANPFKGYQTAGHLEAEMRDCKFCGSTMSLIFERKGKNGKGE